MTLLPARSYQAPEITSEGYSFQIDYYSIGVILHFMLSGDVPHEGTRMFSQGDWSGVSQAAKGVVDGWVDGLMDCFDGLIDGLSDCLMGRY